MNTVDDHQADDAEGRDDDTAKLEAALRDEHEARKAAEAMVSKLQGLGHEESEAWRWAGDGHDDLNSMSDGMVVLIEAGDLRNLAIPSPPQGGPDPRDAEIERLRAAIHRDQTGLAAAMNKIRTVAIGYSWIGRGEWGSYEWDQRTVETLQREVDACLEEIVELVDDALLASGTLAQQTLVTMDRAGDVPSALSETLPVGWEWDDEYVCCAQLVTDPVQTYAIVESIPPNAGTRVASGTVPLAVRDAVDVRARRLGLPSRPWS